MKKYPLVSTQVAYKSQTTNMTRNHAFSLESRVWYRPLRCQPSGKTSRMCLCLSFFLPSYIFFPVEGQLIFCKGKSLEKQQVTIPFKILKCWMKLWLGGWGLTFSQNSVYFRYKPQMMPERKISQVSPNQPKAFQSLCHGQDPPPNNFTRICIMEVPSFYKR